MRFIRTHRSIRGENCSPEGGSARTLKLSANEGYESSQPRREPQGLGLRAAPADPYAVWLAKREAERARTEGSTTRWVHRYPRVTRPPLVQGRDANDARSDRHGTLDEEGGLAVLA